MRHVILFIFLSFIFSWQASGYNVSGVAVDAETGEGLPGIELDLITQGGLVKFLTTIEDGSFTFTNVPDGSHELIFHYYEPVIINGDYYLYTEYGDPIVVNGGDVTGIVFNIPPHHPDYHVYGTLYDATTNQPITDQSISLRLDFFSHSGFFFAWSNNDGTYSFEDSIPDWTYTFNVFENSYYYGADTILAIDTTGPQEIQIDFYLTPKDGVTVSGQLFDIDTGEPIEMANRTVRITAINSMWAETNENGEFTFVNVQPGYYANITVTTEDTAYINCAQSTIYDFIVPDTGISGVELSQKKFVTVHEVTADQTTFWPGETKTIRFKLVNTSQVYGAIWGVELYMPDNITVLNTNPFYNYNTGQTTFEIDDGCGSPQHVVWEGYHSVYGFGNVGNLQALNDSVYTDLEVEFADDTTQYAGIEYHVFYSYACTGGPFSFGMIYLENSDDILDITNPNNNENSLSFYPNPAADRAFLRLSLDKPRQGSIFIYDLTGQEVREVANRSYDSGTHDILVDASTLKDGIYFYVFRSESLNLTGKMVVSR